MDFRELLAYKKSFELANDVYNLTKQFPKDETYSLTDQIRRSSRSVCANIAEAYRKRRYVNHYISKLSDSDAENSETSVWLEFSLKCGYILPETYTDLTAKNEEIGRIINYMINNPDKFGVK